MAVSSPDYTDLVEIENTTNDMITVWWGSDVYNIPPGRGGKIPRIVAKGAESHESYRGLRIINEQANAELAKGIEKSPPKDQEHENDNAENDDIKNDDLKNVKVPLKPWGNPNWDALGYNIDECIEYVTTFGLKINPTDDNYRTIIDEHFLASFE